MSAIWTGSRRKDWTRATEAALALLRDPKAPAQAKSATINAVFRASGLFNRDDDGKPVEPSQMTAEQLERATREIMRLHGLDAMLDDPSLE